MGWFRVSFHVGWCSVDVRAEDGVEAHRKIWEALEQLSNGAIEGLRLGSYTVSTHYIREVGEAEVRQQDLGGHTSVAPSQGDRNAREVHHPSRAA